ncbi:MAG: IS30 family transposase, partial [Glaciimonas sp.]|nr:IS30 family transposase [Glaciimonas sp.]
AAILKSMWPDDSSKTVSHETIYNALYLHPRGELKQEMIACLRHHNQVRKPGSCGVDRHGLIKDMQSIHIRPPEVQDRIIGADALHHRHWSPKQNGVAPRLCLAAPAERESAVA